MSGWTSSRWTVALAGMAAVIAVAGCSSTIEGRALPATETGTVDAVDVTTTPDAGDRTTTTTTTAPTTTETDEDGIAGFDAEVGDCVQLGGTTTDADIEEASCGTAASNYRVISKAARSSECVSDADNYYAESRNGVETGALCLDIDWVIGGCMDVGSGSTGPDRIDCTETTAVDGVKVVAIEENADDVNACGAGSSGYVYTERRFVVCVEEL